MGLIIAVALGLLVFWLIAPLIVSFLPMVVMLISSVGLILLTIKLLFTYPLTTLAIGILFALIVYQMKSEGESQ